MLCFFCCWDFRLYLLRQLSLWNLEGLRPCPWYTSAAALEPRWTVEITLELTCPIRLHLLSLVIVST